MKKRQRGYSSHKSESPSKEERTNHRYVLDTALVIVQTTTFAVLCFYTYYTQQQVEGLKEANHLARQQYESANHALMGISDISPIPFIIDPAKPPPMLAIEFQNAGNSAAKGFNVRAGLLIADREQPEGAYVWVTQNDGIDVLPKGVRHLGLIIVRKDKTVDWAIAAKLILTGYYKIFVKCTWDYADDFGQRPHSEVMLVYNPRTQLFSPGLATYEEREKQYGPP